jgi:hypothetical protein
VFLFLRIIASILSLANFGMLGDARHGGGGGGGGGLVRVHLDGALPALLDDRGEVRHGRDHDGKGGASQKLQTNSRSSGCVRIKRCKIVMKCKNTFLGEFEKTVPRLWPEKLDGLSTLSIIYHVLFICIHMHFLHANSLHMYLSNGVSRAAPYREHSVFQR